MHHLLRSNIVKEGKMIGTINGEETRLTLLLRPHTKANNWFAVYPDPIEKGKHITARLIKQEKPKIKVNIEESFPKIDIEVPLKVQILLIRSFIDYVSDQEKQLLLKNSIENYLDKASEELVHKAQKEFEVDIFRWSLAARRKFVNIPDWSEYDWMKSFPNAEVKVHFNVEITQFGKQLDPVDLQKIKD